MLFNSINFFIFLPIVFILYWFATKRKLKSQNILLLIASYYFYACWDYRFLSLLIFSTCLDFATGLKMERAKSQNQKKIYFWISIIVNLGLLGVFKYYNFFIESFADVVSVLGFNVNFSTLNIILPIGISFYTFHGVSYVVDVYKQRIPAEKNLINYAVFVGFFPLLVAGPIERASHLLPQIVRKREFNYHQAVDGLRQILWGLFKKVVIADGCADFVNLIFNSPGDHNGSTLVIGFILFSIQIYGDFSGYSDIAIGTAKLFGIELLRNFAYPYFSRDVAEYWRRWHISLSSWLRDYVYIPLGGSRVTNWLKVRNILIIFVVSGLWHGANWTFVIWGLFNAICVIPSIILKKNRNNLDIVAKGRLLPNIKELLSMLITFLLIAFARIFFRSENVYRAFDYIDKMFSKTLFTYPDVFPKSHILLIFLFFCIEWLGREHQYALGILVTKPRVIRWASYIIVICLIALLMQTIQTPFIYFQF